jgi:hypothetical protein
MSSHLSHGLRRGARKFFSRPSSLFYVAIGILFGYFSFCQPELALKASDPAGWRLMWGSRPMTTFARCGLFTLLGILSVVIPVLVAFVALEVRRLAREEPADRT